MINLDDYTPDQLEEFLLKAAQDGNGFAKQLFPAKEPGYRRALNMMVKYAETRLDMLDQFSKGRKEKADSIRFRLDAIYRTIPEYAQWL
jgi:hypothetical protein